MRQRVEQLGLESSNVDLRFRLRQPVIGNFSAEGNYGGQGGVSAKNANGGSASSREKCQQ